MFGINVSVKLNKRDESVSVWCINVWCLRRVFLYLVYLYGAKVMKVSDKYKENRFSFNDLPDDEPIVKKHGGENRTKPAKKQVKKVFEQGNKSQNVKRPQEFTFTIDDIAGATRLSRGTIRKYIQRETVDFSKIMEFVKFINSHYDLEQMRDGVLITEPPKGKLW